LAKPGKPDRVKLFTGIIYPSGVDISGIMKALEKEYGPVDSVSEAIEFNHTVYYDEMGENLLKIFFSFSKLVEREIMAEVKLLTNSLEEKFSEKCTRSVNIDPGYMTMSNVFLASCKDFYHRVHIGMGIFLENEYYYSSGEFKFWDWTYPDYKKEEYLNFFYRLRKIYHSQLRAGK